MRVFNNCVAEIKKVKPDGLTTVTIETGKRKRSLNQNALWWKWIGIIAKELGYEAEELANELKARVLGFNENYYNGKKCLTPKSSRKASVDEFSKLMLATEVMARSLNIVLPTKESYGY